MGCHLCPTKHPRSLEGMHGRYGGLLVWIVSVGRGAGEPPATNAQTACAAAAVEGHRGDARSPTMPPGAALGLAVVTHV